MPVVIPEGTRMKIPGVRHVFRCKQKENNKYSSNLRRKHKKNLKVVLEEFKTLLRKKNP